MQLDYRNTNAYKQNDNKQIYFTLCIFLHIVVSNTYCVVFCFCFVFLRLVCRMLPVSLDFPFFISPSVFYNVYM